MILDILFFCIQIVIAALCFMIYRWFSADVSQLQKDVISLNYRVDIIELEKNNNYGKGNNETDRD